MTPDDPRHGERRGYYAHRKAGQEACDPCKRAAAGQEARYAMQREKGIPGRLNPLGTQRRLQALVALGYTWTSLDRWMGNRMAEKFGSGRLDYVFPATAKKVNDLYEALSMTIPPQESTRERQAYTKATRMAQRRGWPPPLAWPDERIDDPTYVPRNWQYRAPSRKVRNETVLELVDQGESITGVCRHLGITRDAFSLWCRRTGNQELFELLASREHRISDEWEAS